MNTLMVVKCCLNWQDIAKSNDKITDELFADGACGGNDVFECLAGSCICPCIKARKNARVRPKTSHILRNPLAIAQRNGFKKWKDSAIYETDGQKKRHFRP